MRYGAAHKTRQLPGRCTLVSSQIKDRPAELAAPVSDLRKIASADAEAGGVRILYVDRPGATSERPLIRRTQS